MVISIQLSEEDTKLFESYAKRHNITISELVRQSVLEKIEDEYDLKVYEKAIAEFEKDPVTYTIKEVRESLDLD